MWVSRAMYLMPDASLCLVQLLPAQGGRRLAACAEQTCVCMYFSDVVNSWYVFNTWCLLLAICMGLAATTQQRRRRRLVLRIYFPMSLSRVMYLIPYACLYAATTTLSGNFLFCGANLRIYIRSDVIKSSYVVNTWCLPPQAEHIRRRCRCRYILLLADTGVVDRVAHCGGRRQTPA